MLIQRMDPARLASAYNIGCHSLYPAALTGTLFPFGSTYCEVPPGGYTTEHNHHENETFLILAGQGRMQIAGEVSPISAGDVVFIPSRSHHRLDNASSSEPLRFISVYWCAPYVNPVPRAALVVPAPPTPNGPLHVGHLSGPYLVADVYARYAASRGATALFAMGTDDNQCYVAAKGRQLGLTGEEVAARFVPQIMGALTRFGCTVHEALHPLGVAAYTEFVQETFTRLVKSGAIELRRGPAPWCDQTGQFIYGAQVAGGCPGCGQPTGGNGCEACGAYNDGHDLVAPRSNLGGPVSIREAEKYYFPLSRHAERLRGIVNAIAMHPRLRAYYLHYIDRGLPDVAVSQFGTWGVPCPGRDGQVLYEWFEMAGSYLYLAKLAAEKRGLPDLWRDPECAVVECFGFDNSFFYGLLVPALLAEMDARVRPPRAFLWNLFYQLDGKKFSTSRGHAIWADEILAAAPPDALRFHLARSRSEDRETNFSLEDLVAFARGTLAGEWQPLLTALDVELARRDRRVPAHAGSLSWEHERLLDGLQRTVHEIHERYGLEQFALNGVARRLADMACEIASAYHRAPADSNNLAITVQSLRTWATLLAPIMPGFGPALSAALGGPTDGFAIDPRAPAFTAGPLPLAFLPESLDGLAAFARGKARG